MRAAIEAGKKGRANSELASLATRDPNAVISFGANVTRELLANLNVGNDTMAKDVNSIRQAYGSVGSTATDILNRDQTTLWSGLRRLTCGQFLSSIVSVHRCMARVVMTFALCCAIGLH